MIGRRGLAALFPVLVLATAPAADSAPRDLAVCEALLARSPVGEAPALCLFDLAKGTGPGREAAARRLEELRLNHPEEPWPALYSAHLAWLARSEAEHLYRRTIELAVRRSMPRAELSARAGLCKVLRNAGRMEEAEQEVKRAVRIAHGSKDPFLRARAGILRATHWTALGALEEAYTVLDSVRSAVEHEGSYPVERDYLFALNSVTRQTGRFRETRAGCKRLAGRAAKEGDARSESAALLDLALTRRDELTELPDEEGRADVLGLARRSLAVARSAKSPAVEAYALWILGSLERGQEAVGYLDKCFAAAATSSMRSYCRGALARRLAPGNPAAAEAAMQEALSLAEGADDVWARTSAWHERMRVSWAIAPPDKALEDSLAALDAIETLREKQKNSAWQPGLFSTWAEDYYWLSGNLLEKGDLDRAFGVIERMRSRTLIDALRLARPDPSGRPPVFASLERVRRSLGHDEALLSFQIAPWRDLAGDFGGGSWLLVSTRGATRAYRLADRTDLRPAVSVFIGMFAARSGSETETAAVLHRKLLSAALADLPEGIRRLVIVPDDALHRLPFAALRPGPDAEPLSARYEISLVPSATLWLGWRESRQDVASAVPLVFADPDSPALSSGALPYSREEGESVVHHLGGGELRLGGEASEAYLKSGRLARFGLLHFATHARMYDVEPDRSCVLLAPGSPQEDGSLQVREIARLALPGRTVVLSSCESAAGGILRGEGVMGLARAFFQAGAHTVVASLWPLRDDDGAALFDRFYRHLADGMTISAALQAAQQDRLDDGAPAEAWAGVLVLGDGDRVPLPGGRKRSGVWVWVVAGVLAVSALLVAATAGRRSRRSSRSAG